MKNSICLIYNYAQHYREGIFRLMDKELPIDFVFGDNDRDIKKMDYSVLKNSIKEVKNKILFRKPFYYQQEVISLIKKDYKTYLILADPHCLSNWILLFLSKLYKKRIFFWTHGWYGREKWLTKVIKKIFFSLSDGIFLYGNYAKNLMIKEGFNSKKLHVIYNSLSYDEQLKYRSKLQNNQIYNNHFNNDNKNLIFIGRLTSIKRLDLLLYTLKELKDKNITFNLTLIGDGEKKNELIKLTNSLGLTNCIWFYGACYSEDEISNLIYNADLCVSPGNVGLTAMHSMAYGTPVLTHNKYEMQVPEFEAILDGKTGIFFKYEDYHSLAIALINWFNLSKDRESIRLDCFKMIDEHYNPYVQIKIFKETLS